MRIDIVCTAALACMVAANLPTRYQALPNGTTPEHQKLHNLLDKDGDGVVSLQDLSAFCTENEACTSIEHMLNLSRAAVLLDIGQAGTPATGNVEATAETQYYMSLDDLPLCSDVQSQNSSENRMSSFQSIINAVFGSAQAQQSASVDIDCIDDSDDLGDEQYEELLASLEYQNGDHWVVSRTNGTNGTAQTSLYYLGHPDDLYWELAASKPQDSGTASGIEADEESSSSYAAGADDSGDGYADYTSATREGANWVGADGGAGSRLDDGEGGDDDGEGGSGSGIDRGGGATASDNASRVDAASDGQVGTAAGDEVATDAGPALERGKPPRQLSRHPPSMCALAASKVKSKGGKQVPVGQPTTVRETKQCWRLRMQNAGFETPDGVARWITHGARIHPQAAAAAIRSNVSQPSFPRLLQTQGRVNAGSGASAGNPWQNLPVNTPALWKRFELKTQNLLMGGPPPAALPAGSVQVQVAPEKPGNTASSPGSPPRVSATWTADISPRAWQLQDPTRSSGGLPGTGMLNGDHHSNGTRFLSPSTAIGPHSNGTTVKYLTPEGVPLSSVVVRRRPLCVLKGDHGRAGGVVERVLGVDGRELEVLMQGACDLDHVVDLEHEQLEDVAALEPAPNGSWHSRCPWLWPGSSANRQQAQQLEASMRNRSDSFDDRMILWQLAVELWSVAGTAPPDSMESVLVTVPHGHGAAASSSHRASSESCLESFPTVMREAHDVVQESVDSSALRTAAEAYSFRDSQPDMAAPAARSVNTQGGVVNVVRAPSTGDVHTVPVAGRVDNAELQAISSSIAHMQHKLDTLVQTTAALADIVRPLAQAVGSLESKASDRLEDLEQTIASVLATVTELESEYERLVQTQCASSVRHSTSPSGAAPTSGGSPGLEYQQQGTGVHATEQGQTQMPPPASDAPRDSPRHAPPLYSSAGQGLGLAPDSPGGPPLDTGAEATQVDDVPAHPSQSDIGARGALECGDGSLSGLNARCKGRIGGAFGGTIQLQDGGDTAAPKNDANVVPDGMPDSSRNKGSRRGAPSKMHNCAHGNVDHAANSHQSSQNGGMHRSEEPIQSFDISIDKDTSGLSPGAGMGTHSKAGQARRGRLAPEFLNIGHGQVLGGAQDEREYVTDPDWREGSGFEELDTLIAPSSDADRPGGASISGTVPASGSDVQGVGERSSKTTSAPPVQVNYQQQQQHSPSAVPNTGWLGSEYWSKVDTPEEIAALVALVLIVIGMCSVGALWARMPYQRGKQETFKTLFGRVPSTGT